MPHGVDTLTVNVKLPASERDFEKEKKELGELVDRFHNGGPENTGRFPHPMFGSFTKDQWGRAMYKHLDHHLKQFGA